MFPSQGRGSGTSKPRPYTWQFGGAPSFCDGSLIRRRVRREVADIEHRPEQLELGPVCEGSGMNFLIAIEYSKSF